MGIFAGFVAGIGVALLFAFGDNPFIGWKPREGVRLAVFLLGAAVIVAVMIVDDVRGLSPIPKLIAQFAAAALLVVPTIIEVVRTGGGTPGDREGIVIDQFNLPVIAGTVRLDDPLWGLPIAIGFTLFWVAGMMNTINWVDGLDGLAGGVVAIGAIILAIQSIFKQQETRNGQLVAAPQWTVALLALAVAGAVLGFLPFNWHPSRIIMGDSGAMFLGYALAVISIIGGAKLAAALLVIGLPIADVAWVIIYRVSRGKSPLYADRGHLHHRLLDMGLGQRQIVLIFYLFSIVFGAIGLLLPNNSRFKLIALVVLALVMMPLLWWMTRRRLDPPTPPTPRAPDPASSPPDPTQKPDALYSISRI